MNNIIKLILIALEVGQSLLLLREEAEFDANIEKIKHDPKQFAIAKFGTKRMRANAKKPPALYSSDPDHHF